MQRTALPKESDHNVATLTNSKEENVALATMMEAHLVAETRSG